MTIIASIADIEPILTGLQTQLNQLQTSVNSMGIPPCMQPGCMDLDDAQLNALSVDGPTGTIDFTFFEGIHYVYVMNNQGIITPTRIIGAPTDGLLTTSIIPSPLPAAGTTVCVGIEIDTGGTLSLNIGASVAGNLGINSLTSPSTTVGTVRLVDIALANVAGTYQLGLLTALTKGLNWYDRRPWALGAHGMVKRTSGSLPIPQPGPALLDSSLLAIRLECSGLPVRLWLTGYGVMGNPDYVSIGYRMDGTPIDSTTDGFIWTQSQISGADWAVTSMYEFIPPAGTHLFQPTGSSGSVAGSSPYFLSTAGSPIQFIAEEVFRFNAINGTT